MVKLGDISYPLTKPDDLDWFMWNNFQLRFFILILMGPLALLSASIEIGKQIFVLKINVTFCNFFF